MNEKEFLSNIIPMLKQGKDVLVGPGDDCAVIEVPGCDKYLVLSIDQLISDVHYVYQDTVPFRAGAKLMKRNVSDIAAMGAMPYHALVSVASGNCDIDWLVDFYRGLSAEADKWNVSVCGGDFARLKGRKTEVTSLAITGFVEKNRLCLRSNAKPGEILYATGCFGNSFASGHHLDFTPRVNEARFISGEYTTAIMDISDGLLIDCSRFAEASGVTICMDTGSIPFRAGCTKLKNSLTDGEDYELIFTVNPDSESELIKKWPFKDTKLTRIGIIKEYGTSFVVNNSGSDMLTSNIGWDHFNIF